MGETFFVRAYRVRVIPCNPMCRPILSLASAAEDGVRVRTDSAVSDRLKRVNSAALDCRKSHTQLISGHIEVPIFGILHGRYVSRVSIFGR